MGGKIPLKDLTIKKVAQKNFKPTSSVNITKQNLNQNCLLDTKKRTCVKTCATPP